MKLTWGLITPRNYPVYAQLICALLKKVIFLHKKLKNAT